MATFTVYFKRKKLGTYHLSKARIRIGREPDSDIFLPNPTVSREHALLEFVDKGWVLQNVAGTNGLFVNGGLVRLSQRVEADDRIEISNYIIHVERTDRVVPLGPLGVLHSRVNHAPSTAPQPTGAEGDEGTFRMRRSQIVRQRHELNDLVAAHLAFVDPEGNERILVLDDPAPVIVGKAEDADIILPGGLSVGAEHARIYEDDHEFYVEPSGAWYSVRVNGDKVRDRRSLRDGDLIEAGGAEIEFRAAVID